MKKHLPTIAGGLLVLSIFTCGILFHETTTAAFITLWFVLEMNRKIQL